MFNALKRNFFGVNQKRNECIIQEAESVFNVKTGNIINRVNLGRRQIFFYIIRYLKKFNIRIHNIKSQKNKDNKDAEQARVI